MRIKLAGVLALTGLVFAGGAYAYSLECKDDACKVYCDNKQYIGTMHWNGSNWSDGVRWDPKREVVAELMVKAWGTSCQ